MRSIIQDIDHLLRYGHRAVSFQKGQEEEGRQRQKVKSQRTTMFNSLVLRPVHYAEELRSPMNRRLLNIIAVVVVVVTMRKLVPVIII